jgi:DNA-directed RNA polymerase specialized sigma24 family protein
LRPHWEKLVGDTAELDYLSTLYQGNDFDSEHPMQELVEDIVANVLTPDELEVFYLRYGEQLSIRDIAKAQGYESHYVIQVKLERIEEKVREALDS